MSAEDLCGFYNPLQYFIFLYPYLMGGMKDSPYGLPYFGPRDIQTVSCYMGLSVLTLAAIGVISTWKTLRTKIWFGYSILMLLLSLGDNTPFGIIVHYMPIYNHIRVPPRHFNDFALSLAVLAAFGVTALLAKASNGKTSLRACFGVVTLVLVMLYPSMLVLNIIHDKIPVAMDKPVWQNLAIIVPLILVFAQIPVIYAFFKDPQCRMAQACSYIFCCPGSRQL